ncbi:MAG: YfiT family bacillithiol transferase [Bacteroidota bacterium]
MNDLRYPIGTYDPPASIPDADLDRWIGQIASLPAAMRAAVDGLSETDLDTPYRPGGWTIRQVVHHTADSHLNALARVKLTLTEETPTIRPYDEGAWAELGDYSLPVEVSLAFLDALHARWTALLHSLGPQDFGRAFYHPAAEQTMRLDYATGMYAWHGRHHTAHVTRWREREGV